MSLFLLTFLGIYLAMHALVFLGVRPLLAGCRPLELALATAMVLMILAPVLVHLLDRAGREGEARLLAWAGYSWMGLLFLAFVSFLCLFLWNLLVRAVTLAAPAASALLAGGPRSAVAILVLVLLAGLYGLFEARSLRVERVRIATPKLPPAATPLRLVQISDLHLGLINRTRTLTAVAEAIEELRPDLLLVTGDLVDAQINHLDGLAELFLRLQPPAGKFAVTGNHEVYAGLGQSLDFTRASGFSLLRGQSAEVGDYLALVGVDDPAAGRPAAEGLLLAAADPRRFTILLKHRPQVDPASLGRFDLQLSGHTHRGQIFPFNLLTGMAYPLQNGLYQLAGGSRLYTSRGTGTWGPPMRILSPPEITLFEIVPEH